jgi:hypothetical protein
MVLASPCQATLNSLSAAVRDACYNLYLLFNAAFVQGESRLWLEDETGRELAARLGQMRQQPRLARLATCKISVCLSGQPAGVTSTALLPPTTSPAFSTPAMEARIAPSVEPARIAA